MFFLSLTFCDDFCFVTKMYVVSHAGGIKHVDES